MDMTAISTVANAIPAGAGSGAGSGSGSGSGAGKSPEEESDRIHQPATKLTNGIVKRHHTGGSSGAGGVIYKECLKNHAASMGGLALDGCGEFMPSPTSTTSDPTSLKCAACGCHRNFHRREAGDDSMSSIIEYQPQHRHHPLPPPPPPQGELSSPQSPPPISSSYYPGSAPHMLLALSGGATAQPEPTNIITNIINSTNPNRKRFRSRFSQHQKDKMYELAETVGWKMLKSNDNLVNGCCNEIGVERGVFKVWMHNNKNTLGKRSIDHPDFPNGTTSNHQRIELGNGNGNENSHSTSSYNNPQHNLLQPLQFGSNDNESNAPANASFSSS